MLPSMPLALLSNLTHCVNNVWPRVATYRPARGTVTRGKHVVVSKLDQLFASVRWCVQPLTLVDANLLGHSFDVRALVHTDGVVHQVTPYIGLKAVHKRFQLFDA